MTSNQLMVLLDIYRGTFYRERHMGTVDTDLATLSHLCLIESRGKGYSNGRRDLTERGEKLIKALLGVASLVSIKHHSPSYSGDPE